MQEELIEMLEGIIDKAEALVEKAKNSAKEPAVPEGWKLVPVEPTDEMYEAGYNKLRGIHSGPFNGSPSLGHSGVVYRAMLAASPAAPSQEPVTLTDEMVAAGARALCKINCSKMLRVSEEDHWAHYHTGYKADAKACLVAALREKEFKQ